MFLLDTDTCIHILKARQKPLDRLEREGAQVIAVSAITHYELMYGARHSANPDKQLEKVARLIGPVCVHCFSTKTAGIASGIKQHLSARGEMIGAHDILIAATALEHGLIIVTGNVREFSRVPELAVQDWSR